MDKLKKSLRAMKSLLYSRIRFRKKKYFLCSRGIGDTVIFLSKLKFVLSKGEKINLIIQNNHKGLLEPYRHYISESIVINEVRMRGFMSLAHKGLLPSNIRFILPKEGYDILGYNGISISDLINISLRLPYEMKQYDPPVFRWTGDRKNQVIRKNHLEKDKAVILGTDAVSVSGLDENIWLRIIDKLKEKGYTVITNLRDERQKYPKGTIGLCLPLNEIYLLAEYAGWFIGLRSGLCDLLAFSSCKMTVIYPSEQDRYKYTFERMGFEKNIEEINVAEIKDWIKTI